MNVKVKFQSRLIEGSANDASAGPVDIHLNDSIEVCDFMSGFSYFCVLCFDERTRWEDSLSAQLHGAYLLLEVISESTPRFMVGIKAEWLGENLQDVPAPDTIKYITDSVIVQWNNEYSTVMDKHLAFQKEYINSPHKYLILTNYFFGFLYCFIKEFELMGSKPDHFKDMELKRVADIAERITYDLHKPSPTVKEMATLAGMSISKFKILFHKQFGKSPHQYILEQKMIHACSLLQSGQYSISQVAHQVGYNHSSGFSRIYNKIKLKQLSTTA